NLDLVGHAANWSTNTYVIRGADQTTPFNQTPLRTAASSAISSWTLSTPTTTEDNCLILWSLQSRSSVSFIPSVPEEVHLLSANKEIASTTSATSGYSIQYTAGVVTPVTWLANITNTTGHAFVI